MIDYLFLIRNEGNPMAQLSPEQMQDHLQQWTDWMGALATEGRLVDAKPLAEAAVCVKKDAVLDGPYAEAKDVIGGFLIVSCASMNEAISTAQACPLIPLGSLVEVRELAPNASMQ